MTDVQPTTDIAVRVPAQSPTTPMREWNVIVAQAEMLAQSDIVPNVYRRNAPNIIAAAIAGRVHGWDAMTAMLQGHVIEGKYGVSPEAQLGLIRGAGHSVTKVAEDRGQSVTVRGTRSDTGDTLDVTWTMADAKAANLAHKQNWKNYPAPMLWARAVSELSTQLFSDVTLGLARYTAEEMGDDEDTDVDAIPARAKPPAGWETWDECDAAHDAYVARWRDSDEDVRRKMTAYAKQSGYSKPMTKVELDELEGQLDVELGTLTVREKPAKVAAAPVVEVEVEDAELVETEGADAPVVPDAVAPTLLPDEAVAESRGEADDPGPGDEAGSTPSPVSSPSEPEASTKGERSRLAQILKGVYPDEASSAAARHAIADIVTLGTTRTTTELTKGQITLAIKVAKGIRDGVLGFGTVDLEHPLPDGSDNITVLDPLGVPGEADCPTVVGCIPEGGDAGPGDRLLDELMAFLQGEQAA